MTLLLVGWNCTARGGPGSARVRTRAPRSTDHARTVPSSEAVSKIALLADHWQSVGSGNRAHGIGSLATGARSQATRSLTRDRAVVRAERACDPHGGWPGRTEEDCAVGTPSSEPRAVAVREPDDRDCIRLKSGSGEEGVGLSPDCQGKVSEVSCIRRHGTGVVGSDAQDRLAVGQRGFDVRLCQRAGPGIRDRVERQQDRLSIGNDPDRTAEAANAPRPVAAW